jgi:hypothetical protein
VEAIMARNINLYISMTSDVILKPVRQPDIIIKPLIDMMLSGRHEASNSHHDLNLSILLR